MTELRPMPGRFGEERGALFAGDPGALIGRSPTVTKPRPPTDTDAATVPQRGALVVGGAYGSLAVARSLGRHDIPVWFVTDDHPITAFSRYTERAMSWAGPDHEGAAAFLLDLAHRHRLDQWLLVAGGDAELRLIAQHHNELSTMFRLTTPPWDVTQFAYDKRLTNQRAAALGIALPWSFCPRDRAEVAGLDCRFPLILKPTVHQRRNAFTLAKAWRVDDRDALLARYDQAVALVGADAVVLQELIPGRGSAQFSYAGLWDRGTPVASLVANRARQYPIDFGYSSTYVRTVDAPTIEAAASRLLSSLGYDGIAEVEFKYDARDQRYKLLDVNARSWTWIALGEIAGVDFPHLLWRIAMGETVSPTRGRTGAGWMHLSRDVIAAFQEMKSGSLSLADYAASFRHPLAFATLASDDLVPALIDLPQVAWRTVTHRLPVAVRELVKKRR